LFRSVYYTYRMTIVNRKPFRTVGAPVSTPVQTVRRLVRTTVDLLFPPRCILCGGLPEGETTPFCRGCATVVERERRQPACPTCAATVGPFEISDERCRKCRNRRPWVAKTVRVGPYRVEANNGDRERDNVSTLGRLLRSYKYSGREELGPILGGWLAQVVAGAPWLDRVEVIVAVPTHWRHRLTRPLYAAEALTAIVVKRTGLPQAPVLTRVKAGPHQIGLSYRDRSDNVRGAFAIRRGTILNDARLLLIDDVKTTGATINECAKVLRRGGAAEVYAALVVTVDLDRPTSRVFSSI